MPLLSNKVGVAEFLAPALIWQLELKRSKSQWPRGFAGKLAQDKLQDWQRIAVHSSEGSRYPAAFPEIGAVRDGAQV
jgi:hypothetical protein